MKVIILLIGLISFLCANPTATLIKVEGKVKILSKNSIKKHKAKSGDIIYSGDKLISYKGSKAFIKLSDDSKIILNENAELVLLSENRLKQESGEVYYKIKKRYASKGLKVSTPFSIIGIKGTEFIVNSTGNREIALNKGLLSIESLRKSFELHVAKVMSEFEAYKLQQAKGYEAYLKENVGEDITYVKSVHLQALKVLSFKDAKNCKNSCESHVSENKFTDNTKKRFKKYQQMLRE
jgi:hypothetical protein